MLMACMQKLGSCFVQQVQLPQLQHTDSLIITNVSATRLKDPWPFDNAYVILCIYTSFLERIVMELVLTEYDATYTTNHTSGRNNYSII